MRGIVLVATFTVLLAACGGGTQEAEGTTPGAPTSAGTMTGSATASPTPAPSVGGLGIVCGGTMEQPGIYTMREDGSGSRRILAYGWDPAVSPEGDRIAFAVTRPGGTDLYLMKANGTHVRRLTHERRLHSDHGPAWSPDGERIAFRHVEGRGIGRGDIWILTLATGELARFTNAKAHDAAPDWSPDGTKIAFASERAWAPDSEGNWDVWVKDVETGDVTRLTRNLAYESNPSWSPDGSAVAFESDRGSGRRSRIWVKELGGGVEQLTRAGRDGDREPDWSPDGSRIVFVRGSSLRVLELGDGMTVIARGTALRTYASPNWRVARPTRKP